MGEGGLRYGNKCVPYFTKESPNTCPDGTSCTLTLGISETTSSDTQKESFRKTDNQTEIVGRL